MFCLVRNGARLQCLSDIRPIGTQVCRCYCFKVHDLITWESKVKVKWVLTHDTWHVLLQSETEFKLEGIIKWFDRSRFWLSKLDQSVPFLCSTIFMTNLIKYELHKCVLWKFISPNKRKLDFIMRSLQHLVKTFHTELQRRTGMNFQNKPWREW